VAHQHPAGAELMAARAPLGRSNHPTTVGAADQLADCGHDRRVSRKSQGLVNFGKSIELLVCLAAVREILRMGSTREECLGSQ
jgi:hypothetical protein